MDGFKRHHSEMKPTMSTDHQDRLTNSAKQVPQLLLNSTQLEPWQRVRGSRLAE